MNSFKNIFTVALFLLMVSFTLKANVYRDITVAKDGSGDVKTITEAINKIPSDNFQRYVIYVKNGVYNEKIRIEKDYLTIKGESRDKTIIQFNQLKNDWVANKDFEGPAVVNIHADDVIIDNLTLKNTMPKVGPTAYVIYGTGTRTIIQNCDILNNGANTVTLVDDNTGMYYLNNCLIEGTVDFMKAMGWCYINNCNFIQKEAIASLWHAGINNPNQKMVINNSTFDGVEHFFIGRHHYDAQMFVLNCHFTEKLADLPLYRKTYKNKPEKDKPYIFGDRHYYFNCKRDEGNYEWLNDNLTEYSSKIKVEDITSSWTFDNQWEPESQSIPKITDYELNDENIIITFDQPVTVRGNVSLETSTGKKLTFNKGKGRKILSFSSNEPCSKSDLKGGLKITSGELTSTSASCKEQLFKSSIK